MGYSVYISANTKTLQQQMYIFLEKNMKDMVLCDSQYPNIIGYSLTDDLSYGICDNAIGFNYKSWIYGVEQLYITEIVKWMSAKIGDNCSYYYDGIKTIIIDSFKDNMYMDYLERQCRDPPIDFNQKIKFIKTEIKRLDKLWNKQLED